MLIYKIKFKLIKCNQSLEINNSVHNTRTNANFLIKFAGTETGQKNIFISGVNNFNRLPEPLKNEKSISKFKNALKKYIYENY